MKYKITYLYFFTFVIISVIFFSSIIQAQTVIKEKITVTPILKAKGDPDRTSHWIIPPEGAFPQVVVLGSFTGNTICYGDTSFYDFTHWRWYNRANVLEGGEYIRFHVGDNPQCFESTSFTDPGDNFTLDYEHCFWASFDERKPDSDVFIRVQLSLDNEYTDEFTFTLISSPYTLECYPDNPELVLDQGLFLYTYADNACFNDLPSSTLFNAKILSGSEYSFLYDIESEAEGTELNGLTNYYGWLETLLLVSNGSLPQNEDTVVVEISTTDPDIEPLLVSIPISKPGMMVEFEPSVIAVGDTANIILKKINEDGTTEDFSPYQLFDTYISAGSQFGTFWVPEAGDTTDEAYYIEQGFKFIANSQFTGSSVQATITVSTSPVFSSKITSDKKMKKAPRTLSTAMMNKTKMPRTAQGGGIIWGQGTVTITNDDCSSAPQCDGPPTPLTVTFKENPNSTFGADICPPIKVNQNGTTEMVFGITKLVPVTMGKHLTDMTVEACYNKAEDHWQFSFGTVEYDLILDLCQTNIAYGKSHFNYKFVNTVDEISNNDICDAIGDLETAKIYPINYRYGAYIFNPILLAHERSHKAYIENYFKPAFDETNRRIAEFKPKCSEINNINDAKERGKFWIKQYFFEEHEKVLNRYKQDSGEGSVKKKYAWEQNSINNAIIPQIENLIVQLCKKDASCSKCQKYEVKQ